MKKLIFLLFLITGTVQGQTPYWGQKADSLIPTTRPKDSLSVGYGWRQVSVTFYNLAVTDSVVVQQLLDSTNPQINKDSIEVTLVNTKNNEEVDSAFVKGKTGTHEYIINNPFAGKFRITILNTTRATPLYIRWRYIKF